ILVDGEHWPFYDRPPLSKQGELGSPDRIALIDAAELASLSLTLHTGAAAAGLDAGRREIRMADGRPITCDAIVIATGSAPVPFPDGIALRTYDDAARIRAALADADSVAIIGAGVLGCELAALAAGQGKRTALIDL